MKQRLTCTFVFGFSVLLLLTEPVLPAEKRSDALFAAQRFQDNADLVFR